MNEPTIKQKIEATLNTSKKYFVLVFFVFMVYVILFLSPLYLPHLGKIYETPIGETLKLSEDTTITLNSWKYDEEQKLMVVCFTVNDIYNNYRTVFKPTAVSKKNPLEDLPIKISVKNKDVLVLQIENIPRKFKAVSLSMQGSDTEKSVKFYCDERTMSQTELVEKTENQYIQEVLESNIQLLEQEIQNSETVIETLENEIQLLKKDIPELQKNKQLYTKEEATEIDNMVKKKETQIAQKEKFIEGEKEKQTAVKEKIDKLNIRLKAYKSM